MNCRNSLLRLMLIVIWLMLIVIWLTLILIWLTLILIWLMLILIWLTLILIWLMLIFRTSEGILWKSAWAKYIWKFLKLRMSEHCTTEIHRSRCTIKKRITWISFTHILLIYNCIGELTYLLTLLTLHRFQKIGRSPTSKIRPKIKVHKKYNHWDLHGRSAYSKNTTIAGQHIAKKGRSAKGFLAGQHTAFSCWASADTFIGPVTACWSLWTLITGMGTIAK